MRLPLHIKCEYKERSAPPYLLTLLTSTLYLIPVLPLHISCTYSQLIPTSPSSKSASNEDLIEGWMDIEFVIHIPGRLIFPLPGWCAESIPAPYVENVLLLLLLILRGQPEGSRVNFNCRLQNVRLDRCGGVNEEWLIRRYQRKERRWRLGKGLEN